VYKLLALEWRAQKNKYPPSTHHCTCNYFPYLHIQTQPKHYRSFNNIIIFLVYQHYQYTYSQILLSLLNLLSRVIDISIFHAEVFFV